MLKMIERECATITDTPVSAHQEMIKQQTRGKHDESDSFTKDSTTGGDVQSQEYMRIFDVFIIRFILFFAQKSE
jgi:hypothetical protein